MFGSETWVRVLASWLQEMMSKAQRIGPEVIAVLDSFLQTSNMAVD